MKKLAKTFAALAAAVVFTVSMAVPASAAAVQSVEFKEVTLKSAYDADGNSIDHRIYVQIRPQYTGSETDILDAALLEVLAAVSVNDLADITQYASKAGVEVTSLVIQNLFDIWSDTYSGYVRVRLAVNAPAYGYYIILHRENGAWVFCNDGYADADGSVIVETDSFSPFAVVTIGTAKTSPKTGESANVAVCAAVVLGVCVLAAVRMKKTV